MTRSSVVRLFVVGALTLLAGEYVDSAPPVAWDPVDSAYRYLHDEHDRFHESFIIFANRDDGGSHFAPELWMGDIVGLDKQRAAEIFSDGFERFPRPGQRRSIRISYSGQLAKNGHEHWMAIAWNIPAASPDSKRGYDLSRYCRDDEKVTFRFWCRSEQDTARVEFKHDKSEGPVRPTVLRPEWTEQKVQLPSFHDPVREFFVIALSAFENRDGASFLLDRGELVFGPHGRKARLSDPRFVRSYVPNGYDDPDWHFFSACYSYDQALALSAYLARGTPEDLFHAKLIADAFVYAQDHDRRFGDGRLRNAYASGDLAGLGKQGLTGETRLPGRWDYQKGQWYEDEYFAGTDSGNMAWIILGLLNYVESPGTVGSPGTELEFAL